MKRRLESSDHPHPCLIAKMIWDNDPQITPDHFEALTKRYGPGSVVLLFESISDLQIRKKCAYPKGLGLMPIPSDHILSESKKIFFAPNHILDRIGLIDKSKRSWGRLMTFQILVYSDGRKRSDRNFRHYVARTYYRDNLYALVLSQRMSISLIRRKYADFMPLFCKDNKCFVGFFKDLPQLKKTPYLIAPWSFADFIEGINNSERTWIRRRIHKAHRVNTSDAWNAAFDLLFAVVREKEMYDLYRERAIEQHIECTMQSITAINRKFAKRVCAHCGMKEIHHQSLHKRMQYKLCSQCQNVFYCSRDCQKKDWRLRHRVHCI